MLLFLIFIFCDTSTNIKINNHIIIYVMEQQNDKNTERLVNLVQRLLRVIAIMFVCMIILGAFAIFKPDVAHWFTRTEKEKIEEATQKEAFAKWIVENDKEKEAATFWTAADINNIAADSNTRAQILYGKELIAHTAKYLGPKGSVLHSTNGMNCQNCHLEAGTKVWGNNYGAVYSTYPKYRARSGKVEDIYKRINDCIERSLNGKALAFDSKEMQAIKMYIEYIGKNVSKGEKPKGSGIYDLAYLNRAINPASGKALFVAKCQSCHQANGEGLLGNNKIEYTYPPLWGKNSYNAGAGLYRMSRFAGYIKYNMPQAASFQKPQLTDEEAWDIAAYINTQPRPTKDLRKDWPTKEEKPIDHPFGPYADMFTEQQHKYGPYQPIKDEQKKQLKKL
jgi:thiosulfate dehydrogenase